MRKTFLRVVGAATCLFALVGCGAGRLEKWEQATGERSQMLRGGGDLLGVTVPVLRAPGLGKVWGEPRIQRDGQGGYCLTYIDPRQPSRRLMVHGMKKPLPKLSSPPALAVRTLHNNTLAGQEEKQDWRSVPIAGERVRWFQQSKGGGSSPASFSTEGFSLESPDGRKGHYRLVAEQGTAAPEEVVRWFGSVSF